jgi:hypothetical protein
VHVIREPPPSRDLDDGNPLAVLRLERRIAVDLDLTQREAELVASLIDDAAGCLAEMAARRAVERDLGRFYG